MWPLSTQLFQTELSHCMFASVVFDACVMQRCLSAFWGFFCLLEGCMRLTYVFVSTLGLCTEMLLCVDLTGSLLSRYSSEPRNLY